MSYNDKFNLPETEIHIMTLECSFKATLKKVLGSMFVFQEHICFESGLFGFNSKEVIRLDGVTDMTIDKKILSLKNKKWYHFSGFNSNVEEIHNLILGLWQNVSQGSKAREMKKVRSNQFLEVENKFTMTDEDWELLIKGKKKKTFSAGDYIVKEGDSRSCIYQIVKGTCSIIVVKREKGSEKRKVISQLLTKAIFGEMTFLELGAASASVIADEEVLVYKIEGAYINSLFVNHPSLAGHFFAYIAEILAERLQKQEKKSFKKLSRKMSRNSSKNEKKIALKTLNFIET